MGKVKEDVDLVILKEMHDRINPGPSFRYGDLNASDCDYYKRQMDKLDIGEIVTIKLVDSSGLNTNFMSLNKESIHELRLFLNAIEEKLK